MFLDHFTALDLTHSLNSDVPTWGGSCGFHLQIEKDYDQVFRVQKMQMQAGIGTHMDAPSHRIEGAISIADIALKDMITPTCMINVSKQAQADYEISVEDIKNYESTYGTIPEGALIIGYTGWSKFWSDPRAYRNENKNGIMHFPSFSAKAAEFLLMKNIAGIAIDTLSPDCSDLSFPVHRIILGAGKYIIENIADCSQLPPQGAYTIVFPLKIEACSESPVRIISLIPT